MQKLCTATAGLSYTLWHRIYRGCRFVRTEQWRLY